MGPRCSERYASKRLMISKDYEFEPVSEQDADLSEFDDGSRLIYEIIRVCR